MYKHSTSADECLNLRQIWIVNMQGVRVAFWLFRFVTRCWPLCMLPLWFQSKEAGKTARILLRTGRNAGWKWRIRTNLQRLLFGYRGSSYHQTFSQWDGTGHHVTHDFSITRCLSAALAAWLKLTQGLDPMLARCCHDCARILTIDEWDCLMILTDEKGSIFWSYQFVELSISSCKPWRGRENPSSQQLEAAVWATVAQPWLGVQILVDIVLQDVAQDGLVQNSPEMGYPEMPIKNTKVFPLIQTYLAVCFVGSSPRKNTKQFGGKQTPTWRWTHAQTWNGRKNYLRRPKPVPNKFSISEILGSRHRSKDVNFNKDIPTGSLLAPSGTTLYRLHVGSLCLKGGLRGTKEEA